MAIVSLEMRTRATPELPLPSNGYFDSVEKSERKNKKPSAITEGIIGQKISDSVDIESKDGTKANSILADPPNLYKQTGGSMAKMPSLIPFSFIAIPEYFYTSGWLPINDPKKFTKMMTFLHWAFKKCSPNPKKVPFDGKIIELGPYEFIYGRTQSAKECGLTVEELRHQLNSHLHAKFIEKAPSSTPSRFTVYRWLTDNFCENNPQLNPPLNPQLNPQLSPHKSEERYKKKDKEDHPSIPSFEKEGGDGLIDDFSQKKKEGQAKPEEEKILVHKGVYLTKPELEDCIAFHGSLEKVKWQIEKIQTSPDRKEEIQRWAYCIKKWKFPNETVDRTQENERITKILEQKYDGGTGWMISFSRDINKDCTGILFQNPSAAGYSQPIFINHSDPEYERKVKAIIKEKRIKAKDEK